jgi:hypothetical protein
MIGIMMSPHFIAKEGFRDAGPQTQRLPAQRRNPLPAAHGPRTRSQRTRLPSDSFAAEGPTPPRAC